MTRKLAFQQACLDNVRQAEKQVVSEKERLAYVEAAAQTLDTLQIPPTVELQSFSQFSWNKVLSAHIFVVVRSIPDVLPLLEQIEAICQAEVTSADTEKGERHFHCHLDGILDLTLHVTPADDAEGACQKVLVGMDEYTGKTQTPRYAIRCS